VDVVSNPQNYSNPRILQEEKTGEFTILKTTAWGNIYETMGERGIPV